MSNDLVKDVLGGAVAGGVVGGVVGASVCGDDISLGGRINAAIGGTVGAAAGTYLGAGTVVSGKICDAVADACDSNG